MSSHPALFRSFLNIFLFPLLTQIAQADRVLSQNFHIAVLPNEMKLVDTVSDHNWNNQELFRNYQSSEKVSHNLGLTRKIAHSIGFVLVPLTVFYDFHYNRKSVTNPLLALPIGTEMAFETLEWGNNRISQLASPGYGKLIPIFRKLRSRQNMTCRQLNYKNSPTNFLKTNIKPEYVDMTVERIQLKEDHFRSGQVFFQGKRISDPIDFENWANQDLFVFREPIYCSNFGISPDYKTADQLIEDSDGR